MITSCPAGGRGVRCFGERLVRFGKWLATETRKSRSVRVGFRPPEVKDLDGCARVTGASDKALSTVGENSFNVVPRLDIVLIDGVIRRGCPQVLKTTSTILPPREKQCRPSRFLLVRISVDGRKRVRTDIRIRDTQPAQTS